MKAGMGVRQRVVNFCRSKGRMIKLDRHRVVVLRRTVDGRHWKVTAKTRDGRKSPIASMVLSDESLRAMIQLYGEMAGEESDWRLAA